MVFEHIMRSRFFRRKNTGQPSLEQRMGANGHPYRSPFIPQRVELPKLEVLDDYILVRDIFCVDADGNLFEYYPELYLSRNIERKNGDTQRFTPYQAIVHFEEKGMFLPSLAATCNFLNVLLEHKENAAVAQLLKQYNHNGLNSGWHVQNTLIDWENQNIIHYPSKEDFPTHGGNKKMNHDKRREFSFNKMGLESMRLEKALRNKNAVLFLKNLTGVQNLSLFLKLGEYFNKESWLFVSNYNQIRTAWLGCGSNCFILLDSDLLDSNVAARGVHATAGSANAEGTQNAG